MKEDIKYVQIVSRPWVFDKEKKILEKRFMNKTSDNIFYQAISLKGNDLKTYIWSCQDRQVTKHFVGWPK